MRQSRCVMAGGKRQEDGARRRGELQGSWCWFVLVLCSCRFGKGPS